MKLVRYICISVCTVFFSTINCAEKVIEDAESQIKLNKALEDQLIAQLAEQLLKGNDSTEFDNLSEAEQKIAIAKIQQTLKAQLHGHHIRSHSI